MPVCEMCGRGAPFLKKAKIEGAILEVCDKCARSGEVINVPGMSGVRSMAVKRVREPQIAQEEVLSGFGRIITSARSAKGWDTKKLAEELHAKETLMHKIEAGKLKPDLDFARKIERTLGIKIIGTPETGEFEVKNSGSGGMTIGDFIKVKKRK